MERCRLCEGSLPLSRSSLTILCNNYSHMSWLMCSVCHERPMHARGMKSTIEETDRRAAEELTDINCGLHVYYM